MALIFEEDLSVLRDPQPEALDRVPGVLAFPPLRHKLVGVQGDRRSLEFDLVVEGHVGEVEKLAVLLVGTLPRSHHGPVDDDLVVVDDPVFELGSTEFVAVRLVNFTR